jgi:hypothetical protein
MTSYQKDKDFSEAMMLKLRLNEELRNSKDFESELQNNKPSPQPQEKNQED